MSSLASSNAGGNSGSAPWTDPSLQGGRGGSAGRMEAGLGGGGGMESFEHDREIFPPATYSTLDEPVMETIMRDVRAVSSKLRIVMTPMDRNSAIFHASYAAVAPQDTNNNNNNNNNNPSHELSENDRLVIQRLKDWDLWGPLVLCLGLAILLSLRAPSDQSSLIFAAVFFTIWVGGTVVTVNAQLLGGTISFFQCLCVLGYSIFPLTLSALVIGLIHLVIASLFWIDLIVVAVGFLWAIRSSAVFISLYIKPERRFLALYPVLFFYTFLGWMILLF